MRSRKRSISLPLPPAIGNEMERFLDLIADPTAGNMITTLFLDRQRADKQAAPYAGVREFRVALPADDAATGQLRATLGKAKVAIVGPGAAADIEVPLVRVGKRSFLATLAEAQAKAQSGGLDEDGTVLALSEAALQFASSEDIGDRALADVAAVVGGVIPAYAGGPFAFASRKRGAQV